jgi:probable rRNA maturation factor
LIEPAEERIAITIEQGGWTKQDMAIVKRAAAIALESKPHASVSILLDDDAAIRPLNKQFRGKDAVTNVLSFPAAAMPGNEGFFGDIIIARQTVEREAAEENKAFAHHLSHLVIHGILHLLGQDHETADEAQAMEAQERALLMRLGIADPYRDTIPDQPIRP